MSRKGLNAFMIAIIFLALCGAGVLVGSILPKSNLQELIVGGHSYGFHKDWKNWQRGRVQDVAQDSISAIFIVRLMDGENHDMDVLDTVRAASFASGEFSTRITYGAELMKTPNGIACCTCEN